MDRYAWARKSASLDPDADAAQIYRILAAHEFPWDLNQALSFALFRTYAVPSIGRLLYDTGQFTGRTQKRYDDTVLLLDTVLEQGLGSGQGRTAVRRVNQMHAMYDISADDMRYVLATFVVVPIRWLDRYGWRRLTEAEKVASANYYREVGRHLGIRNIPATHTDFAAFMDAYERANFAFDAGARAVADATLDLMATFPPNSIAPAGLVKRFAYGLMDDPLLDAFHYPRPTKPERALSHAAVRARGRVVRFLPPRVEPMFARQLASVRSYPDGYDVRDLGTFVSGCPVPHAAAPASVRAGR
jgi:hypothetical protein